MAEKMRDGIIKRGKLYYYVVRELDPTTGKKKPRWVKGAATRAATVAMRDKARNSVHDGTYVAPQNLTVAIWLERWMDAHAIELKPSTVETYRNKIRLYLVPAIGHERLQSLSPSRLSIVWRDLHQGGGKNGKPVSPRTVEFARAVLRKAMEDAVVERLIQVNPVVGSKLPKRDGKPQHTTWTGAQLGAFLEHIADHRWLPLWQLAASTGMRRGELAGLAWRRVDLEAGTVAVEVSTTQIGNDRVTTTPKNHERRTIAIDAHMVAALRAWRKQQAAERLAMGPAYADVEGLVFTWEDGRPVMPDYMTKAFESLQASLRKTLEGTGQATFPRIVVHELRHTHATLLLRAGVPVHIVAKRLGHKDPSVTLNVYADVIPDDDTSAVDVFSRAVWGA